MNIVYLTRNRLVPFFIGVALVFLLLFLSGRIANQGPGCGEGLGQGEVYFAYASVSYGWPLTVVMVEQIACQEPPGQWAPQTRVIWYPRGIALSLLQLLTGGLLLSWSVRRLAKRRLQA